MQQTASATGKQEATRGSPGRQPREDNDDCTQSYRGETHKFTERRRVPTETEASPSCGWRGVYAAMGVAVR